MARDRGAYSVSRRSFCSALAGVLVAPDIAFAQASKAVRRIGVLWPGTPDIPEWLATGQANALRDLGWVEGQNVHIERRYANGRDQALWSLAEELVRAQVEIIVTSGTPATLAAKRATTIIPIVFDSASDPVLLGLVPSLARPGGNVTGYSIAGPEVTAKRLSVLKELLPRLQRIGVLQSATDPYNRATRSQLEQVCESLHLVPIIVEMQPGQIGGSIDQLTQQNVQALMFGDDVGVADEIVNAATKRALPTMAYDHAVAQKDGALIAYSATWDELFRRRAENIDRILRGAKPADLPIQQPTKYKLVINLKTAKALDITVAKELLLRADEVIQ